LSSAEYLRNRCNATSFARPALRPAPRPTRGQCSRARKVHETWPRGHYAQGVSVVRRSAPWCSGVHPRAETRLKGVLFSLPRFETARSNSDLRWCRMRKSSRRLREVQDSACPLLLFCCLSFRALGPACPQRNRVGAHSSLRRRRPEKLRRPSGTHGARVTLGVGAFLSWRCERMVAGNALRRMSWHLAQGWNM